MKPEEKIVADYLIASGYNDLEYEPNGNVTPDFVLNKKIAIEVRRLNQHYLKGEYPKPLEQLEWKLIPRLTAILESIFVESFEKSFAVSISFERPLKATKQLFKTFEALLRDQVGNIKQEIEIYIHKNLKVRLIPLSIKWSTYYVLGSYGDNNGGGLIIAELYEALKIAINEKENKISQFFSNFDQWWLILINTITFSLDNYSVVQLMGMPKIEHRFNKILILSPNNNSCIEY